MNNEQYFEEKEKKERNYLIISTLTLFYSSIFTCGIWILSMIEFFKFLRNYGVTAVFLFFVLVFALFLYWLEGEYSSSDVI